MFGRRFELFKLFGFPIRVDLSWFVIAVLITWSLAVYAFPRAVSEFYDRQLGAAAYWTMGLLGAAGLFASIVLHELGHALMARRYGLPMGGITLFIFGGVAEMTTESPSARAEFMVAIAGPIVSVLIAVVCFVLAAVGSAVGLPIGVNVVLFWLSGINLIVVAFNLIPAFPLDGGRVLRSALWAWKGSLRWATRVSSRIGSVFGIFLIVLGVFQFMTNPVGGVWLGLLGFFLYAAARGSYQQLLIRKALEGETVRRFMSDRAVTVPAATPLRDVVEDYIYKHHFKMYPVVADGRLVGCVTTQQIGRTPRDQWERVTAGELADACTDGNTVGPDEDAMRVLSKMHRSGASRMMVVQDGRLLGIISLKDLMAFMSLKVELEEE